MGTAIAIFYAIFGKPFASWGPPQSFRTYFYKGHPPRGDQLYMSTTGTEGGTLLPVWLLLGAFFNPVEGNPGFLWGTNPPVCAPPPLVCPPSHPLRLHGPISPKVCSKHISRPMANLLGIARGIRGRGRARAVKSRIREMIAERSRSAQIRPLGHF